MADQEYHVFLSHSRNDPVATGDVFAQLRRQGLDVFKDDESIGPGDEWLVRLQSVLEGCGAFVVLVGRDGVRRWVGAEAQVALNRHFGPHDDAQRLPIFPILLDGIAPEMLPPLLRLFQVTRWTPGEALPADLLSNIRDRNIVLKAEPIAGCPFVGLASYRPDQAHLFFGRRAETLDVLACFRRQPLGPRVKWLEINGNSGSGKSSLMQAGLLPLIEQGWLWPRTGYEGWKIIGPMMPGARPVEMLAEKLAQLSREVSDKPEEMDDICQRLAGNNRALGRWLRTRKPDDVTAFLLAIHQFEELFTFAEAKTEPWRANTFESWLRQPTAVGMHPAGASSTGVLDMTGTVWEWCLNKFDAPSAQGIDCRVMRGGSWINRRDVARSTVRNAGEQGRADYLIGLRVVCSSPSTEADNCQRPRRRHKKGRATTAAREKIKAPRAGPS